MLETLLPITQQPFRLDNADGLPPLLPLFDSRKEEEEESPSYHTQYQYCTLHVQTIRIHTSTIIHNHSTIHYYTYCINQCILYTYIPVLLYTITVLYIIIHTVLTSTYHTHTYQYHTCSIIPVHTSHNNILLSC